METLQLISIALELIIVAIALGIALKKKMMYGWGFALTFAIYVFYDLANVFSWEISVLVLQISFFIATISMLVSILEVYKKKT